MKQIMLSKTVVLMALHLQYIHSNCRRWFLFWKSFTHLPSSYEETLLCQDECQRDLPEAGQQLANLSEQAGPATGSVFTNDNSCEQRSHQCLGNSPHRQSDLLPRWNFYWFIYFIFFWTEINQGPMLETGKLHKSQQWNKLGTMPNSDRLGGLLHSVHVKISSCKEFPAKHTGCFYYRVGGIWYSIPIRQGGQWTRHYSTATSLEGHWMQKYTSVISCTA